ncbi:MAG: hypothetical protein V1495_01125 [Pseudomonadota bacterium]
MDDGLAKAATRFHDSASTAGAMPRFFIGVGTIAQRDTLCKYLGERGFQLVQEPFAAPKLWPRAFERHEGSHFNSTLFVLTGLEHLYDKFGDEVLRRIQVERRMLERTATWTLLWLESFPVAGRLRSQASQLWKGADDSIVLPPVDAISKLDWKEVGSEETLLSGIGEIAIPKSVADRPLSEVLTTFSDPELRFWADLIRLRPTDALLTMSLAAKEKKALSAEAGRAVISIASVFQMQNLQKTLRSRLGQEEFLKPVPSLLRTDESRNVFREEFERMRDGQRWVELGEALLGLADLEAIERSAEAALETVNSVLGGPVGWIPLGAGMLFDRPIRLRAMILRAVGMVSEAAADLDTFEEAARSSGLDPLLASALEARAYHVEDLGDLAQAESLRIKAEELKSG